ncbi:MAG: serine/threonine protein kinase [Candidatus Brocadiae bacterium]|nr:serine/threonine protein kinase [Candidatus Brocadiia bacterium]
MADELKQDKIEKPAKNTGEMLLGQCVHGYHIVQQISTSLVFLAFKDDPDHQVAMKVFYPDPYACNHDVILERLQEIKKLDHENIVKVYETGETEDFIYAIMEYVPGENLYDLMRRNPRLHWAAAGELAREITKGLVSAHALGITHRSLHPDRILLGKGGQIKINFCNEGEITPSGEIANYVPPELFLGETLEEYSDIYSLGAIIYNIVTGNAPLAGKTPKEIAMKHREMEPVLAPYGVSDVPYSLSAILSRSLSKDLRERYFRSFELHAAINNFILNDIGKYKIGSYKELLPKVVEVSESGKAFDQALHLERDKRKKDEKIDVMIDVEDLKTETDSSEILPKKRLPSFSPLFWKIIILCFCSLILNIILFLSLKK